MKIEIKHRYSGSILFSIEAGSMKLAMQAAVEQKADLRGAYLRGADLGGADLGGADLGGADLGGADLGGADLRGADLGGADLGGADLRGAYLGGADLGGADLRGADLGGAKNLNKHAVCDLLMLLDQPGPIRAYKMVMADGKTPFQYAPYEVGETYSVDDANADEFELCARGINLATLPWCLANWKSGYRILIAEFTAADIACIPVATDGKFRVHRCTIVGEKTPAEIGLAESEPVEEAAASSES